MEIKVKGEFLATLTVIPNDDPLKLNFLTDAEKVFSVIEQLPRGTVITLYRMMRERLDLCDTQ